MPDPRNPSEQGETGQENLPGTDFYESEAGQDERVRGERIGSTFEEADHERRDREQGKQAE